MKQLEWEETYKTYDMRYFQHKKYPFIKIRCRKIGRGKRWIFSLRAWGVKALSQNMTIERFDKKYLDQFFRSIIRSQNTKNIIFEYLFEGNWDA